MFFCVLRIEDDGTAWMKMIEDDLFLGLKEVVYLLGLKNDGGFLFVVVFRFKLLGVVE